MTSVEGVTTKSATGTQRPALPPGVSQYFIPVRGSGSAGTSLIYHPALLGIAEIGYSDSKTIDMTHNLTLLTPLTSGPIAVDWGQASLIDLPVEDLEESPEASAQFAELPGSASKNKSYDSWQKDLVTWIYRNQKLELLESPSLEVASNTGV